MENNELLAAIGKMMDDKLENALDPIKQDITGIKQEMTGMKEQIQAIDQRTTKIEVHLENTVSKTMQLLLEGQQGMNQKFRHLDDLTEKVEDIQTTVEVLKRLTAPA